MFTWKQHPYHRHRAMSTPAWLAVTNRQNNMLYVIISKDLDPSYWYLEKYRLLPKGVRQLASTWSSKPVALIMFFLNTGLASNEDSTSAALEAALEGYCNVAPGEAHPVCIHNINVASLTLFSDLILHVWFQLSWGWWRYHTEREDGGVCQCMLQAWVSDGFT